MHCIGTGTGTGIGIGIGIDQGIGIGIGIGKGKGKGIGIGIGMPKMLFLRCFIALLTKKTSNYPGNWKLTMLNCDTVERDFEKC